MQLRQLLQVIIKAGDVLAPTIPGAAEEVEAYYRHRMQGRLIEAEVNVKPAD